MPLIVTAILLLGLYVQDSVSYCNFPEFLQIHTSDNIAHWISKTKYKENTEVWNSQEEITVSGREIVVKLKFHGHCYEGSTRKTCYKKEHLYRRVCMKAVGNGKYRVQHLDSGKGPMYTCMQFIRRNDNVVQIKTASPLQEDEARLCDDSVLQRQEWPWIAPVQKQWSPCPVVGGFDFRTFIGERRQKMCQRQWRPSRLESECVMGEGLRFHFPQRSCSPFQYQTYKELHCWASWKESGFIFIIAGELAKSPQYVLRLPADPKLTKKKKVPTATLR